MAGLLKVLAVLFAVAAVAACAGGPPPPTEPSGMAIVGTQLIDGTGGDPIRDSAIVIRDDRIVGAGPRETTDPPEGSDVVDVAGQIVIPGLVHMHGHYGGDVDAALQMLRTQLYFGVITALSIGTDRPEQRALMIKANAGRPGTPRIFTVGCGFPHSDAFNAGAQQPTSTDEAREMLRAFAGQAGHFVKMWVNETAEPGLKITPAIRTAIVDEAIANGLVPVAHIDEEGDGRELVEAGLSDFLHTTVRTFGPGGGTPMDGPEPSAEFSQMYLDNSVSFTPTFLIVQDNWHFTENPDLLDDPDLRRALNPHAPQRWSDPDARAQVVDADDFETRKAAFRQLQDFVETMHDAGVRVAPCIDGSTANVPMGWGTHHELELYVQPGLTPMQACVAATATSATVTPPVGEAEFGTLEVLPSSPGQRTQELRSLGERADGGGSRRDDVPAHDSAFLGLLRELDDTSGPPRQRSTSSRTIRRPSQEHDDSVSRRTFECSVRLHADSILVAESANAVVPDGTCGNASSGPFRSPADLLWKVPRYVRADEKRAKSHLWKCDKTARIHRG